MKKINNIYTIYFLLPVNVNVHRLDMYHWRLGPVEWPFLKKTTSALNQYLVWDSNDGKSSRWYGNQGRRSRYSNMDDRNCWKEVGMRSHLWTILWTDVSNPLQSAKNVESKNKYINKYKYLSLDMWASAIYRNSKLSHIATLFKTVRTNILDFNEDQQKIWIRLYYDSNDVI